MVLDNCILATSMTFMLTCHCSPVGKARVIGLRYLSVECGGLAGANLFANLSFMLSPKRCIAVYIKHRVAIEVMVSMVITIIISLRVA